MSLPLFRRPRLQDRIVIFFVVLLGAVQLASFVFIRYTVEKTSQNALREEMRVGARVFRRLLEQNSQQLVEATSVLAYDFGFREAVATRDRDTILSALRNHAARIRASGMAVVGLDGLVVADSLVPEAAGTRYPHDDLVARAAASGRSAALRVVNGHPYQLVVVPVQAPLPIAWVSMSFAVDDRTARDLQRISSSDVTFVRVADGRAEVLATTLYPAQRRLLLAQAADIVTRGRDGMQVSLGEEAFEVLATPLEDERAPTLFAILERSVSESLGTYLGLQAVLLLLASFSMAVTLFGGMRIARRITQPLSQLSGAAREVTKGNYDVRLDVGSDDEIGELSRAFQGMVKGLAERDGMRDALGKVASSEVVLQLLKGEIELGGEEREVSVMFTDIRNFTALCETLSPQQSLQLLNQFLTAISEVVEAHGGVVDKYLGDGVMAIFGAPVTRADDAQRALECSLEIRKRVSALGPALAARGLPHPDIGIGVNTSGVIAGNIGSPTRLNYTVLGDGVNLASRLEGLTKRYLVPIVAGALTRERVTGIMWRELDKVRVRGRTVAERIYEPVGRVGEVPPWELERLDRWHEALEHFRERRWPRARSGFEALASDPGYARLASLYLGYLRELVANPPGPEWDASFTLYDK